MQELLLLHEVPFEMTCLLLFVFSNFLPKLKRLLALCFCFVLLLWVVLFIFWDGFSKWLSTGAQQQHQSLWRLNTDLSRGAVERSICPWFPSTEVLSDQWPLLIWISHPLCCKSFSLALSYLSYCGVWVFPLQKDVLHDLKPSLWTCAISLESLLDLSSCFFAFSLCHCSIQQFCLIAAYIWTSWNSKFSPQQSFVVKNSLTPWEESPVQCRAEEQSYLAI